MPIQDLQDLFGRDIPDLSGCEMTERRAEMSVRTLIRLSSPPVARCLPSGLNRTLRTYTFWFSFAYSWISTLTSYQRQPARMGLYQTHQVFSPVFTSNICAVRLQPVARYLPSGENVTLQTTLYGHPRFIKRH